MESPLCQQIATNTEEATVDKPELVYLKQIGDPEKIENYGKVEQGGESIRYIRQSIS